MKGQRGVALLSALLIFTLLVILIGQILVSNQNAIERTSWISQQAQAEEYAYSGEIFALEQLREALKQENLLTDENPLFPLLDSTLVLPADGVAVESHIKDMQGLINLNNLVAEESFQLQFASISSAIGLRTGLTEAIEDWVDSDAAPRGNFGAEDDYYLALPNAHRTANRPMGDVSELLLVRGLDLTDYERISPWLTALPTATRININTAPAGVFNLINPNLSGEQIVSLRDSRPNRFANVDEFMQSSQTAGVEVDPELFTTRSDYYEIQTQAIFGETTIRLTSSYAFDPSAGDWQLIQRTFNSDLR